MDIYSTRDLRAFVMRLGGIRLVGGQRSSKWKICIYIFGGEN